MVLNSRNQRLCIIFRRRGLHPDPYLVFYYNPIHVKKKTKLLRITLDSKLTLVSRIKGLKKNCVKALNL